MTEPEVDLEALLNQVDQKGNFDLSKLNSPTRINPADNNQSKISSNNVSGPSINLVKTLHSKASVGDNTSLGDKLDEFLNALQKREYEMHSNKDSAVQETDANSLIKLQPMRKISMEFSKKSITSRVGEPTIIRVSSRMTCIGTNYGLVLVFESNQELQCILGSIQSKEKMLGYQVTSLDISQKSEWCIVGYENGIVIIWDLESGKAIHKADLFPNTYVMNTKFLQDKMKFIATDINGIIKINSLSKSFFGYSLNTDTIDKKEKNQLRLDVSVYHHPPSNGCFVALGSVHEVRIVYINHEMDYKLCHMLPEHHDSSFDQLEERIPYMNWQKQTYYDEVEFEQTSTISPFKDSTGPNSDDTLQTPIRIAIGWGNVTDIRTFNPFTGKFELDIKYSIPTGESERIAGLGWLGDSVLAIITEKTHLSTSTKKLHIVDPFDPSLRQLESFKNFSQYLSNDNEMVRVQDRSVNLTRQNVSVESIDLKCSFESSLLEELFISYYHNHLSVINGYMYFLGKYSVTTCSVLSWKERLSALAKLKAWDELFDMGKQFFLGKGRAVIGLSSNLDERQRDCAEQFSQHLLTFVDMRLQEIATKCSDIEGDLDPLATSVLEIVHSRENPEEEEEKPIEEVLSKEDLFKYELYSLLENTFNHCLEINYNELVFDDIYQRFKGRFVNIYYQMLCEFVNQNKLSIIPPERFSDFFKYGEKHVEPVLFNTTLQNLSLSNQSVVRMLSSFTKHNPRYFGAYAHAQTRGLSDFTTPIAHMLNSLKTCEKPEDRENIYSVLLHVIDMAMDEHVKTKKEILENILDYHNNFGDLKLICATPKTCNLFLNTLLNVLLDPSSSNRNNPGTKFYTSEYLFPVHNDLEGYVNQIYLALDSDAKRKVTISDLDSFSIPQDLTTPTADKEELSPLSLEIYMFLGVLFENEVLSLTNYTMLHRTFIYLIKSANVEFPYPHPRIKRIEDLLKSLLKLVRKSNGNAQKNHPLMDHYRKLKYLAETQKLNSLVVEFYRSDEKKEDELNLLLDRVEDRDYGSDEKMRDYDVRLIMEFVNRGKFVYETLSKKLQNLTGEEHAVKRKRIEQFFLAFLQNVLQDARQKVEQNGSNLTDELHQRRLLINEEFQKCYVTLLARVGSEAEVIEYLEEQPHQLNIDECLEICQNLPNATSYLYAQKGETQKLLETIVEDLERKKQNLLDHINTVVMDQLERQWLTTLIALHKKKPKFLDVLSGTAATPSTPSNAPADACLLTPEENFALQYYALNMDIQSRLHGTTIPADPENPLPYENTLNNLNNCLNKNRGMQSFLDQLASTYKCQMIDNFDFNRCINEPMTHPPNVALDDMASDKKLELPCIDGKDILESEPYLVLKKSVINANITHLSHMSISKTLDDNDIQNLWFSHLEGPFLGYLRVLRYGFANEDTVVESIRDVSENMNEDTQMTDLTEISDDEHSDTFFDDFDSDDEEDLDPLVQIQNKQIELAEIEKQIIQFEDLLADDPSNVELKRKIEAHRQQQTKLNTETIELQKKQKQLEEKQHQADIDVNSPKNINRLSNLLIQRCIGDCVLHILEAMQRYVDAPSIIEKVVAIHSVDPFSRVKNMVMRMLNAYGYDRMLMGRANVLLANDTYKIGAQYHGKLLTGTSSEHGNVCMHCQRDLKVGDPDIRLFYCGHLFHVSCLRSPHLCLICSPLSEDDDHFHDQANQFVNDNETNSSLPLTMRLSRIDTILDRENDILRTQIEFHEEKMGNAADRALEAMNPNKGSVNLIIDDRLTLQGSIPSAYTPDTRGTFISTAEYHLNVNYLDLDSLLKS